MIAAGKFASREDVAEQASDAFTEVIQKLTKEGWDVWLVGEMPGFSV